MPEVFTSNYMKQQRNYVHYKRRKAPYQGPKNIEKLDIQSLTLPKDQRVPIDTLLLVVRIKESRNTSPQAQKILNELGLKEVNNCAFIMSTIENIKKLLIVGDYVGYGQPTKKVLDDVIRKRGFLKTTSHERTPISNNVLIEELLGSNGIICIEDVIHELYTVGKHFKQVSNFLWPFKLNKNIR